ncbi:hypothetical protein [Natrinema ejinorense]|uniref:Uncharacterized protein n=1 Tax=Natrinema ejinorense TaxID=373386 RepID=A0A2A5QRJ5_9EURY|nr:hypothetical protein [Natrinema ejinorense]PCR89442.1 hypothetical protein CP557_02150 [Natrinema ejinorense]
MTSEKQAREQQQRQREELQERSASSKQASRQAEQLVEETQSQEFLEEFRDADMADWIEEELGPELSQMFPIANESREDYRRHRWLNENRAERIVSEHDPGRLCRGPLLELAQGVHDRPDQAPRIGQTDQERRHVREAETAKTAMQSLGIEARGLRSVTEAVHTSRLEKTDEGDSGSSGRIRGALNKVFD